MKQMLNMRMAIDWWLRGLMYFCPIFIKRMMGLLPDTVTIMLDEEKVICKYFSNESNEPLEIKKFSLSNQIECSEFSSWTHEQKEKQAKIILVIMDDRILKKKIQFPAAAESNLREALGFELNRRTPFSQEQAYFDYRIIEHDKQATKLQIELFVVPRQKVDPKLDILKEAGVIVDTIKSVEAHSHELNINLLPKALQPIKSNQIDFVTSVLATAAFVLFLAMFYMPLIQQSEHIKTLEKELEVQEGTALEAQKINEEKIKIIEQKEFLNNKFTETLNSVQLINEVTQLVPDDSWLTRLVIKNGELQVQGESANASALVEILESSKWLSNTRFRSPVTKNNATGKDKFHLSSEVLFVSGSDKEVEADI